MKSKSKYSTFGIAIGAALGAVLGAMAGNMGVWLAIGVAVGLAIGASLRGKRNACAQCEAFHSKHGEMEGRMS